MASCFAQVPSPLVMLATGFNRFVKTCCSRVLILFRNSSIRSAVITQSSLTMATPALTTNCDVSLLLVGKTGVGKSATGNSILNLNKKPFHAASTDTSVTSSCQFEYSRYQGRTIKVVDMPGLSDSCKDKAKDIKDVVKEATTAVDETRDGYDAVLVVVQFGRQSREDSDTLDSLKKIFTKNLFSEHGILVVTHGDDFKSHVGKTQTFADFCSQQKGLLNKLWKECKKRVVLFDNATGNDEEKETQREELFGLVDDLIGKNKRKKRYTPEMFHASKTKRDQLIAKSEELVLTDGMKSTLRLLMHDLNSVKFETPDESITQLREIKTKTQEFIVETKLKDTKVKKMKAVLTMAESIKKATERKMKMAVLMMSLPNSENIDSKDKVVVKEEIELEEQYEILLEEDISPKTIMAAAVLLVLGFGLPVAAGGAVVGAIVGAAKGAKGRDVLPYAARGVGLALRVLPFSSIPVVEKVNEAIELKVKYCTAI